MEQAHEIVVLPVDHLELQLRLLVNDTARRCNLLDPGGCHSELRLKPLGRVEHLRLKAVEGCADPQEIGALGDTLNPLGGSP